METGDILLYLTIVTGLATLIGIIQKERGIATPSSLLTWLVRASTALLVLDLGLLTYYFLNNDYSFMYVYQYNGNELPTVYKLAAVFAGQPGTFLLWTLVNFIGVFWLSEKEGWENSFVRKVQFIAIIVGIYLVITTLIDSPFKTIYDVYPDLHTSWVPDDGNSLNPLLINQWMAVHPPVMFVAYGLITIPFAAALVFMVTRSGEWERLARQWSKITWFFLSIGLAVGGLWAYEGLSWGGFWAWDPVETSSFIPWLTLTAAFHAMSQHRKNRETFDILAPVLIGMSYILIWYASLVTRSGLYGSVHAFGAASTGTALLVMILLSLVATAAPAVRNYLEKPKREDEVKEYLNRNNIFLVTIVTLCILALISFWGITFPVFIQIFQGQKVQIGMGFFNLWSYPFAIIFMLMGGLCLNYRESEKDSNLRALLVVVAATIAFAFIIPDQRYYLVDHQTAFFNSLPPLYKLIGSLSMLSIFPSLVYMAYGVFSRASEDYKLRGKTIFTKRLGDTLIHVGVVLIMFGSILSSSFGITMGATIPIEMQGMQVPTEHPDFSVKLVDFKEEGGSAAPSISGAIGQAISSGTSQVTVSGTIGEMTTAGRYMLVTLEDNSGNITVATLPFDIKQGSQVTVSGVLMSGFQSNSTGKAFDMIVLADPNEFRDYSPSGIVYQKAKLEVYQNGGRIGSGTAVYLRNKQGEASQVMIDRSLFNDVYVIFSGMKSGSLPLTIKIVPFPNEVWAGVILFLIGISLLVYHDARKVILHKP
ncbi:MAG TPA: cytochrome c biogenesis protein CcsA [Candidatus Methanoperedenaceae archaeon]|nr:cytochrome c biogenesis protein CcsA [Candidatus Methanoperedenaceae archaeon]